MWNLPVQKARRILGLLYRRFYGQASQDSLKQLYPSLVRPHLEYAIARCGILTSPKIEMPWKNRKNLRVNWLLLNGIAAMRSYWI